MFSNSPAATSTGRVVDVMRCQCTVGRRAEHQWRDEQDQGVGPADQRRTVTWTGTGNLTIASGNPFINQAGGTFDVRTDAVLGGFGMSFNNAGTFTKSAGAGTTTVNVGKGVPYRK